MIIIQGKDTKRHITFKAKFEQSEETKRECVTCGGQVRRSWVSKILHRRCRYCRYLVMMYGPSIEVTRADTKKRRAA